MTDLVSITFTTSINNKENKAIKAPQCYFVLRKRGGGLEGLGQGTYHTLYSPEGQETCTVNPTPPEACSMIIKISYLSGSQFPEKVDVNKYTFGTCLLS